MLHSLKFDQPEHQSYSQGIKVASVSLLSFVNEHDCLNAHLSLNICIMTERKSNCSV